MRIVIAGASGFIGKELINILKDHHEVIGISRYPRNEEAGVKWVQCDLFSLIDIENTLANSDVAVYLVHSMLPSARLTQGSFRDFDMILADNFSRAAKKANIKKIVYLSGIIPPDAILSEHLQSRLEVENILKSSGIPTSSLRAGLIIGPGGSSFEMMLRLVERLPVMICPYWTSTLSYPISVWDAVHIIKNRIENQNLSEHECLDICGPDSLSYEEMMSELSKKLNRKHFFLPVPFVSPQLSKLWVRLITGAPKDLVYPLVDSLKTHMIPISPKPFELNFINPMSFNDSITKSLALRKLSKKNPSAYSYKGMTNDSKVRSVQRVTTLFRSDAKTIAELYFKWLGSFFKKVITVHHQGNFYNVNFCLFKKPLLVFEYSESRSFEGRELYYIRSGLLVSESKRARLEFRDIYQGLYKIIAIHDYRPSLPWYIYKYTQAIIHLFVMRSFGKYLIRKKQ
jgi:uncharacterized protein YbjT (DUF2867 family)